MSIDTEISWTDHSSNLWWGCVEVAPECDNCYAREWAKRFDRAKWGAHEPRLWMPNAFKDLAKMQREAARDGVVRSVFIGSMMDIGERSLPLVDGRGELTGKHTGDVRDHFFAEVDAGRFPNLLFLLLSKRPQNYPSIVPPAWLVTPPANVMYGATAGSQKSADLNVPALLRMPGKRFLSCEPMLGAIKLPLDVCRGCGSLMSFVAGYGGRSVNGAGQQIDGDRYCNCGAHIRQKMIDWIIAGGESGPKARPMHPDWARSLRDQCAAAGVAFHFKQWGEWCPEKVVASYSDQVLTGHVGLNGQFGGAIWGTNPPPAFIVRAGKKAAGRLLDGRTHDDVPTTGRSAVPR